MSVLVREVIGIWRGVDGKVAEVAYEGGEPFGPASWAAVDALLEPRIKGHHVLQLSDGSRTVLLVKNVPDLLPDCSGVLVIFDRNRPSPKGFQYFPPPNNAAIFNADGSLRFQLLNPFGEWGSFRAALHNHLADGRVELGVRVCPSHYPASETVYVIDGSTPDLSKQLPRWVRD